MTEVEDWETRVIAHDPALVIVGSPSRGYNLHRHIGERVIPLAGETLEQATANAAMGLIGARSEDALFKGEPRPVKEPAPGCVYFIGGDVGGVKIGFAVRPEMRVKDLQCGSPVKLRVLATVAGMPSLEREYHKRFADRRLHGEWFDRCPEIEAEIARLSAPSVIQGQSTGDVG